jgi:hypothetical protein
MLESIGLVLNPKKFALLGRRSINRLYAAHFLTLFSGTRSPSIQWFHEVEEWEENPSMAITGQWMRALTRENLATFRRLGAHPGEGYNHS